MSAAATATCSPRISFSHDVNPSPPSDDHRRLDASLMALSSGDVDDDFDFSVSLDSISASADELFSNGKLLPLSSIKPAPPAHPTNAQKPTTIESSPSAEPTRASSSLSSSFWNIGRSRSVGSGRPKLSSLCPFPRSKSTGSHLNQSPSQSQNQSQKKNRLTKRHQHSRKSCYYYSGSGQKSNSCGNGVRINPVINVPTHFIPRGGSTSSASSGGGGGGGGNNGSSVNNFFAYLLCNCRDKSRKELECGGDI